MILAVGSLLHFAFPTEKVNIASIENITHENGEENGKKIYGKVERKVLQNRY